MNEITTKELKQLIDKRQPFTLIDCRGQDYYHWEHIPHAINIRWKYVKDKAPMILKDKNTLIVTSCDGFTCGSSIRCYDNLKRLGYKNLAEYSGGIADWKAHGFATAEDNRYKMAFNVYRFPDQTFAGEPVGSYLIEEKDFILLIDGPQQLTEEHEDFILHFDKPIKVFMSHGPTAGDTRILQKKYRAQIFLHKDDIHSEWLTVKPDVLIEDGFTFNKYLKVIHTPGHSRGSSVVLDVRNHVLFAGDHVEGNTNGEIADFISTDDENVGDKTLRFKSARKLLAYNFDVILPFHYDMVRKNAKNILMNFINKYEADYH